MKKNIYKFLIIFTIVLICFTYDNVNAQSLIDAFDYSQVDDFLKNQCPESKLNVKEIINNFISGDGNGLFKELEIQIKETIKNELVFNKQNLITILIICILSGFLTAICSSSNFNMASDTGFYILYVSLITVLISGFTFVTQTAINIMDKILEFMKAFLPVFVMSLGIGSGMSTATVSYGLILGLITICDFIFTKIIIPLISLYVVLSIINSIYTKDWLSKFPELIENVISWITKTILAVVLSINFIKTLVAPSIDQFKRSIPSKAIGIIPGIGKGADTVSQLLFGSGKIIKNAFGGVGLVVLIVIICIPIIKITIFSFLYQGISAIVQPITDKRIVDCISAASKGANMILKALLIMAFLFFITIAIICLSTNLIV